MLEARSSSCGGSDGLFVLSAQRLRPWAGISGSTSRFVSLRIDCFLIILLWSWCNYGELSRLMALLELCDRLVIINHVLAFWTSVASCMDVLQCGKPKE